MYSIQSTRFSFLKKIYLNTVITSRETKDYKTHKQRNSPETKINIIPSRAFFFCNEIKPKPVIYSFLFVGTKSTKK